MVDSATNAKVEGHRTAERRRTGRRRVLGHEALWT